MMFTILLTTYVFLYGYTGNLPQVSQEQIGSYDTVPQCEVIAKMLRQKDAIVTGYETISVTTTARCVQVK